RGKRKRTGADLRWAPCPQPMRWRSAHAGKCRIRGCRLTHPRCLAVGEPIQSPDTARGTTLPLFIGIQYGVIEVVSRDRFNQLAREGCLGLSARGSAVLQQRQHGPAESDGALVAVRPAAAASRRPQADPCLRTAHFERADLAAERLVDIARPHATPFDHLRDGGKHCLCENSTSHGLPILPAIPGLLFSRTTGVPGSIWAGQKALK